MSLRFVTAASFAALTVFTIAGAIPARADASATIKSADTDSDGTIDLAEAKKAGMAKFEKLNPDNDGTLDAQEAKGLDLKAVSPDNDGTIDKAEYAAAIEQAFKKASPDGDGTVDEKELATPAGQELAALIQ